jgi:6-phosphogluconolactonase
MPRPTTQHRAHRRTVPRGRFNALAASASIAAAAGFVAIATSGASAAPVPWSYQQSTVYTETNQVAGNTVLAYSAGPSGALTQVGSFPTGGTGTGAGPASQGGVTLGDNGLLLAVVNGGSNSVSVFAVGPRGNLALVETASSGGLDPISVTIHGIWVYVLNNGSATVPGNISGFVLSPFGHGPTDTQALNAAASSPEQVGFTPNGRDLLVTEKASNTIDVFPVNFFGLAGPAVTTTLSSGIGPYGFGFTPEGVAVVSEAAYGGVGTFWVNNSGTLSQISQVADGQLAPCWVAVTASGNEVFAANAHSGTVSAYDIAPSGTLALLPPAVQANPGIADTDLAIAGNSNLYISDQPDFDASAISPAGSLSPSVTVASGLPTGTFGLAATSSAGF